LHTNTKFALGRQSIRGLTLTLTLNICSTGAVTKAALPFSKFAGSFETGVWGIALKAPGLVLALGPTGNVQKQDYQHTLVQVDLSTTPPTSTTVVRALHPPTGSVA
jgi:hypothetical protein